MANTIIPATYARNFFINIPTYASTTVLSQVDTTKYPDQVYALVPSGTGATPGAQLGIYTFFLNSTVSLVANQVLSAGGNNGRWIRTPQLGVINLQDNTHAPLIDYANLPSQQSYQYNANITFAGTISNAGATANITLATTGSKVGDSAFVTCLSYTNADTCIKNGIYSISTSSANQVSFSMDGAPGASLFSVITLTPIR